MAGNKLGIAGISIIIPALEKNQAIKVVGIAFNEIEDEEINGKDVFKLLCMIAGIHKSIQLLNLSGNYFSENGYKSVIAGLEARKSLGPSSGTVPLEIKVSERTSSKVYDQVHSLNLSLNSGRNRKRKKG